MQAIQPIKAKIRHLTRYNIHCSVCATKFEFARTRPKDRIFVCARCRAEMTGQERVAQDVAINHGSINNNKGRA